MVKKEYVVCQLSEVDAETRLVYQSLPGKPTIEEAELQLAELLKNFKSVGLKAGYQSEYTILPIYTYIKSKSK